MGTGLIVLPVRSGSIRETRSSQQTVGRIHQYREISIVQRHSVRANCVEWSELGTCSVREHRAQAGQQHQPQKICHELVLETIDGVILALPFGSVQTETS